MTDEEAASKQTPEEYADAQIKELTDEKMKLDGKLRQTQNNINKLQQETFNIASNISRIDGAIEALEKMKNMGKESVETNSDESPKVATSDSK